MEDKKMVNSFNKEWFDYLFPQRTRLKTEYSLTKETEDSVIINALNKMLDVDYQMIKGSLPEKANSILDIGCGLGFIDIALNNHYNEESNIYLLDKTNFITEDTHIRGFNKEYVFYNSMESTKENLLNNGVKENKINSYEVSSESIDSLSKNKYDIIISLLSCGWHYSLETYIDLIKNTLSDEGIFIVDIRHDTDQLEYAKKHFKLINVLTNTAESKHTGGTIGDRYIFKKY